MDCAEEKTPRHIRGATMTDTQDMTIDTAKIEALLEEENRIADDDRANEFFYLLFANPDGYYQQDRDEFRFTEAKEKIMGLGYSERAAHDFLNINLSYCDDD
jgi:hypothetical protein